MNHKMNQIVQPSEVYCLLVSEVQSNRTTALGKSTIRYAVRFPNNQIKCYRETHKLNEEGR